MALLFAGLTGAVLVLPAIVFVGSIFIPPMTPAPTRVAPVIANALWARGVSGAATALQPINPFTIGRAISCHAMAEWLGDAQQQQARHDECAKLTPGIEVVGYLSSVHLRNQGVWQDPRVPFAQIATMTKISESWTREQLLDTLAERAEFPNGIVGVESAARLYFGRASAELSVPQAALLTSLIGLRSFDPWCNPTVAATRRGHILSNMRVNAAIDDTAYESASRSELGLTNPPRSHQPCKV